MEEADRPNHLLTSSSTGHVGTHVQSEFYASQPPHRPKDMR